MRAVYLIGVDHRFQRVGSLGLPPEVTHEFACKLKALVREHQICGIAEEMSIDGLGMHRSAGGSVPFLSPATWACRICIATLRGRFSNSSVSHRTPSGRTIGWNSFARLLSTRASLSSVGLISLAFRVF